MGWWTSDDGLTFGDDPYLELGQRLRGARDAWTAEGRPLPSLSMWLAAARDALRAQGADWCADWSAETGATLELSADRVPAAGGAVETVTTADVAADPELVAAVAMALDAAAFSYEDILEEKPKLGELVGTLRSVLGADLEDYVEVDEPFDLERLVVVGPT